MEWAKGGAEKQRCTTKNAGNGGVASRFKLRVPQLTPERQPHENRRTAPRHCKSAGGSNGYGHHLDGAYADTPGSHGNATAPDIATGTATMRRRTGQHFDTRTKRTCSVRGGVAADGKNSNCANLSTATALAISFWRLRHAIDLIGFTSNPSRYSFGSCLRRGDGRWGCFYLLQFFEQCCTKRVIWLLCAAFGQIADGCLPTLNSSSNLRLRHLAVTLNFGNDLFPVHFAIITVSRYSSKRFFVIVFP